MGGGSSKSTTAQTSTQTSTALSADGVITGGLIQGAGAVTITDMFPEAVADAFTQLIQLTEKGLVLAGEAGSKAIDAVGDRRAEQENPGLATTNSLTQPAVLGAAAFVAYMLLKR